MLGQVMPPLGSAPRLGTPHLTVGRFAPDHRRSSPGPHAHPHFAIVFVEDGSGSQRIGMREFAARAGDLFLIVPGEAHDARGLAGTVHWVVEFAPDCMAPARPGGAYLPEPDELFLAVCLPSRESEARRYAVPPGEWPHWTARLTCLDHEIRANAIGCHEAAHALLELLLIDLARLARPTLPTVTPQTYPLVVSVFRFIERRFRSPIGLADVAKALARSPSYLTGLVRRETGRTVLQWIIERRMAEARRLLVESDVRVKDIGPQIGYDDTGHFIRQFRRVHGATPQRWRHVSRAPGSR